MKGSDQGVVVGYLEEVEVKYVNSIQPVFLFEQYMHPLGVKQNPQSNLHLAPLINCPTVTH